MRLPTAKQNGFTLLELMTVLVVVAVLLSIAVPSLTGVMRAMDLTTTGEAVYGVLHTARQAARAKNQPVEVRFYREGAAGPVVTVEAHAQRNDGLYERIAAHSFAEGRGIITLDREMTSILTGNFREDPNSSRPGPRTYELFRFRPDGSTELAEIEKWFLTLLHQEGDDDNYYTILVNPLSGNLKTYRP